MGHVSQTHCLNGHEYTLENTYWERRKGRRLYRRCRTCTLANNKIWDTYKRGPQHTPKKKEIVK